MKSSRFSVFNSRSAADQYPVSGIHNPSSVSRGAGILFLMLFLFTGSLRSQITQTLRGKVIDKESQTEIIGASVYLVSDTVKKIASMTDVNGDFRLQQVPIGRHAIKVTFVGYKEYYQGNIVVDAGKETIITVEMEESVTSFDEVTITGNKENDSGNNEMSLVGVKTFNIEETNRYAGSRSDPSRMASNFAGVNGGDDSRNDITIRGNSPMGLLWRIEGVDLPNPNHFAIPGSTGGAISILNNKVFGTSDFFTGAFPSEYGNANAGVFDIRLRNGNNEKHEFTAQLGFLGTEFSAEGPLSKKQGSTYLVAYRYSTLKLFESLNLNLGTSAVPYYQDLSFKLNFPSGKGGNLSLFAVGGDSKINIELSKEIPSTEEVYGQNDRDQLFRTSQGMFGISFSKPINDKTFFRVVLSAYGSYASATHTLFYRDSVTLEVDTMFPKLQYEFKTGRTSLNLSVTKKFNPSHSVKFGLIGDYWMYNYYDSVYNEYYGTWSNRLDYIGTDMMAQPYFQWKWKKTDDLAFTAGVHGSWYSLNNSFSVEPRAGMKWSFTKTDNLTFGYGLHSQLIPNYVYFQHADSSGNYELYNKDLGFSKSHHLVLGWDHFFKNSRMKIETYYQYLFDIPVDTFSSSFSLLNQGSTFSRFFPGKLVNEGTGYNYGVEFTFEKSFSKSWYMLFTAAVYESKYKGSDGVLRNTDFNGRFATNALVGKEFKIGTKGNKVITTATKITYAGGKLYSPADITASQIAGDIIAIDSLRNTKRFHDYFRADIKLGIKINTKRVTHEIAIDLVNIFDTKNVLGLTYAPDPKNPSANPVREEYQLGFLPLFYYKIDF